MYIGCHKTLDPNDDYIGSGKLLKRAIKKYGRENFIKEILFIFDTPHLMFEKEKEIVDKLFVEANNTYNLLLGGSGGFDHINSTGKNLYGKNGDMEHGGQYLRPGNENKQRLIENGTWEEYKKKVSEGAKRKHANDGFHWTGRKHKESTKEKISEKMKICQAKEKNSQYGTCWIYSAELNENKKIRLDSISIFLSQGWVRGRKV